MVLQGAKSILGITAKDKSLRAGLMVCAHMGSRWHHGKASTHALWPYCVWASMGAGVGLLVRQCLHGMDGKVGELKTRSLRELVHGGDGRGDSLWFSTH